MFVVLKNNHTQSYLLSVKLGVDFVTCCSSAFLAEREGFEPPEPLSSTVFKTAAIDHSAISPCFYFIGEYASEKRCKGTTLFLFHKLLSCFFIKNVYRATELLGLLLCCLIVVHNISDNNTDTPGRSNRNAERDVKITLRIGHTGCIEQVAVLGMIKHQSFKNAVSLEIGRKKRRNVCFGKSSV